jgi:hypothetical protein
MCQRPLPRLKHNYELDVPRPKVHYFSIPSQTEVSHTMFSQTDEYEPAARKVAFSRLAEDIVRELSAKP